VLNSVSEHLGPPSNDTGWYTLKSLVTDGSSTDCLANIPSRILRWGDLAIAFFDSKFGTGGEFLWSWSVGAPISSQADRREPGLPASPSPTRLRTAEGVHVGSSIHDVVQAYGTQLQFSPVGQTPGIDVQMASGPIDQSSGSYVLLSAKDSRVDGIGASLTFC
jgi:hypothetical protein